MAAKHLINGNWVAHGTLKDTINPASGEPAGQYHLGDSGLVEEAIGAARQAFEFETWSMRPRLRAEVLLDFANQLERNAEELVDLIIKENGKIRREAIGEVRACVSEARYYAGLARTISGRVQETEAGKLSIFLREPVGVVGIIVPWNAPAALLVRSLAPALAVGCTVVIKPAPQTSNVNHLMMACLQACKGLPKGVVNSVNNDEGSVVGQAIVASENVDCISFTGSSATGKSIMAGAAGTLKRLSLELGGKAPALVFADADLSTAVSEIVHGAIPISGQMCMAVSRVLVHRQHCDELADKLAHAFGNLVIGPGSDPATHLAPLIDVANRDRVLKAVEDAGQQSEILLQGQALEGGKLSGGAYCSPSIIAAASTDLSIVQEEIFGPVITLETFTSEAEAIDKANATRYGLAASVYTQSLRTAQLASRRLKAGTVWINSHLRIGAETETGGYRQSGFGRLHGPGGLDDFLETKHIYQEVRL